MSEEAEDKTGLSFKDIVTHKYALLIALVVLGLVTRFAFIWHPPYVVFDEYYFSTLVKHYFEGTYYFDIHPPFGKLLIALFSYIFRFVPEYNFTRIGAVYPDNGYILLRVLPNLFGALMPLCIFFFVRSLRGSVLAAFFAGLAIVFENAILTQSHFILLDSTLWFFGFLGLALFFWHRNFSNGPYHLSGSGICLALAISVKWTGLGFLGLVWMVSLWDINQSLGGRKYPYGLVFSRAINLIGIPFLIYTGLFWIHFALLPNSGPGDESMSPQFQKSLLGSKFADDDSLSEPDFWKKYAELNRNMYFSNAVLLEGSEYGSKFYEWPLMERPVKFGILRLSDNELSAVYLLGNPFIWWFVFFAMLFAVFVWKAEPDDTKVFLYAGWLASYFPFFFIHGVFFLYHYIPALVFSVVITALFLFDGMKTSPRMRLILFATLMTVFIAGFLFFMPLSYGLKISPVEFGMRMWSAGWP